MASILRQIVAGPRIPHPEAGLDLCYVTDNIIATSGPSATYPQRAYRNPLDELVAFLDSKHDKDWCIWEFRAEGTGYPDSEVYGRIHHFPWPDHHPPPFALIPSIVGSMKNWLHRLDDGEDSGSSKLKHKGKNRVAVVHCKAGKGRSGTVACSYLISQEGWSLQDALKRFTERRMRSGFGDGVSIPSQVRWVGYVHRWTNQMAKKYIERPVEILEIHVWGLRDGVKVAVEGFVDEGKKIKCFHLFHRNERTVVDDGHPVPSFEKNNHTHNKNATGAPISAVSPRSNFVSPSSGSSETVIAPTSPAVSSTPDPPPAKQVSAILLRPSKPVILPTSDINIDFERRSKAAYTGWAMVTSVAHVWFNAYFEGGDTHTSGVFETEWEVMDGIKGSGRKGVKALDRLKVVWRYPPRSQLGLEELGKEDVGPVVEKVIGEPEPGEPIPESHPADWRGENTEENSDSCLRDQENISRQIADEGKDRKDVKGLASSTDHSLLANLSTVAATAASATSHSFHEIKRELGLRKQTPTSQDVSLANSMEDLSIRPDQDKRRAETQNPVGQKVENGDLEGVQSYFENRDIGSTEQETTRT
ncbi:hypothetical protein ASPZODRAFT_132035 [Penicilliopsis zonata CBS 506.65]|uniref:phosphatidylinositol-3,4,5-trisphosphate 3-phosphatase n=1 Tax=Penicilliopsis zonata CBS 506.65 TaxID=1073090 RepID=A0A1L9SIZ8_9EURO|nr:hypothetical protein ASPZODRAFT_132035 [Penicilliopsis zonata CBS 506.65]OJJ47096.1 hypothetical protein ASPZODRAFT_132035 [Penicilliopsis zonata CBS 506.65]